MPQSPNEAFFRLSHCQTKFWLVLLFTKFLSPLQNTELKFEKDIYQVEPLPFYYFLIDEV